MPYFFYIFFGILPSFIWILFYLKKDAHPESKIMIIKIFFYGMLMALPAIFLEKGLLDFLKTISLPNFLLIFLNIFIAVALVEELLKYLVVQIKVLKSPEFDEPVDAMIYMIVAALGFAAAENTLIFFSLGPTFLLGDVFLLSIIRFWGATFLHALCSALLGYFLALSLYRVKNKRIFLLSGLSLATLLHGLYNFSIIELQGPLLWLIPIIILISLAIFVAFAFKRLKKIKSVCKII